VFGNAVRDASGMVQITEFSNTIDLSNVSGEIDKIIRKEVLPPFKQAVKKGDNVDFIGAIALNEAHLNLSDLEIIPVNLKLQK
jgi:predicted lipoprotein